VQVSKEYKIKIAGTNKKSEPKEAVLTVRYYTATLSCLVLFCFVLFVFLFNVVL
jgi:hypothetical protein